METIGNLQCLSVDEEEFFDGLSAESTTELEAILDGEATIEALDSSVKNFL